MLSVMIIRYTPSFSHFTLILLATECTFSLYFWDLTTLYTLLPNFYQEKHIAVTSETLHLPSHTSLPVPDTHTEDTLQGPLFSALIFHWASIMCLRLFPVIHAFVLFSPWLCCSWLLPVGEDQRFQTFNTRRLLFMI